MQGSSVPDAVGVPMRTDGKAAAPERKPRELSELTKPFWAVIAISSISLLSFVALLTIVMDVASLRSSEQTLNSILLDRTDALSTIAIEYGFWDETVENAVENANDEWIDYNLGGLHGSYGIAGVHIFDGKGKPTLSFRNGERAKDRELAEYGSAVSALVASARVAEQGTAPIAASGVIGTKDHIYLASAINLTTYTGTRNFNTDHVLLLTRKIDGDYLASIRETYQLWGLSISNDAPGLTQAVLPIKDVAGKSLGTFVWSPKLAGARMLPSLLIGIALVFGVLLIATRTYLTRAAGVMRELEQARAQAEEAMEALGRQARQDPLTGIGNRRRFEATIKQIRSATGHEASYAFMSVDLDGFKQINDTFGHEAGDKVLRHFATMFEETIGRSGTVFRLGGDEFVAVLKGCPEAEVVRLAGVIVDALKIEQVVDGVAYRFGASIGASFSSDPANWLTEADTALYAAKRNGRGRVVVFKPQTATEISRAA